MLALVDTSVWVDVLRDATGRERSALDAALGERRVVLSRFTQLELLQGCRSEREWDLLASTLDEQDYLEAAQSTWSAAARIYFLLRRSGRTVRSPIDCLIAQVAMDHDALLLHRDRDFSTIGAVCPLREAWVP